MEPDFLGWKPGFPAHKLHDQASRYLHLSFFSYNLEVTIMTVQSITPCDAFKTMSGSKQAFNKSVSLLLVSLSLFSRCFSFSPFLFKPNESIDHF